MAKIRNLKVGEEEAAKQYKRFTTLKSRRSNWESHWQEVADYFIPTKAEINRISAPGQKNNLHIYDGTGIQANELLAGALHGMLTNPSSYWFEYTTGIPLLDKNDTIRKWLEDTTHITHEVLNASNFQTEIHEVYIDQGSVGFSCMSIERDPETVVRFLSRPIAEIYVDENSKGTIDTVFRCYKWKPRQFIQEFGEDTPEFVLKKADSDPECEIEILHVVEPRADYDKGKRLSLQGMKFKSCYYTKDGERQHIKIREKGFNTMPYVTPRWTKGTGEVYGRSPAMKCLSDVKMINEMMKVTIRAAQKTIDPPLLVPDDGILGSLKLTPGGINYYRSGSQDMIKPLMEGANLSLSFDIMDDVRKRIRDAFYVDQLQLQEGPQMTATEVMQRTEEKIRLLGPILGRQQSELLRPLIDRVFEIMLEARLVPPIPKELAGRKLDVKYRSSIAKAQLASEANNINRVFQVATPFLNIDPNAKDVIDCDAGVKFAARLYGLPQELVRDENKVKELRQARDQANQAMLQQQQEMAAAEQAQKVAPAVGLAAKAMAGGKERPPGA